MTFKQLQDRVMLRLNWTSTDSRDLVKFFLNERYREVQTSLNLAPTRFGTVTAATAAGNALVVVTSVAKIIEVFDPITLKRPLTEVTVDQIRALDSAAATSGTPDRYALYKQQNDSITFMVYPKPTGVGPLSIDGVLVGTEMSADGDEPTLPKDFHDILERGALADGYDKIEKADYALKQESKFEKRLADLRFFLIKSARLRRVQSDNFVASGRDRRVWPYSNLA